MKMTDGKRTVDIQIRRWNGSGWDPDWSNDFFDAGTLPYDEATDTYRVDDVQYCIDMANDPVEGACLKTNKDGETVHDDDMEVIVEDIDRNVK